MKLKALTLNTIMMSSEKFFGLNADWTTTQNIRKIK